MLQFVFIPVLAAHLLAANLAVGAPLVALVFDFRGRNDPQLADAGRFLIRQSIIWLVAVAALGWLVLGLLWFVAWKPFIDAASLLPVSRYWYGAAEWAFSILCLAGYAALWPADPARDTRGKRIVRRILGIAAATNTAYHFPVLFSVIAVYSTRPELWTQEFDFRYAAMNREVLAHVLHFSLASLAMTGVLLIGRALALGRRGADAARVARLAQIGGWLALAPSVAQLAVGAFVLVQLPPRARAALLGNDLVGTVLFALALIATFVLLQRLAAVALGDRERRDLVATMTWITVVVVLMVAAQHRARRAVWMVSDRAEQSSTATHYVGAHELDLSPRAG